MTKNFIKARSGNIAMMFALLLVPLMIAAGMGVDMMRGNQVRTQLAEASDSGLLAGARAKILDSAMSIDDAEVVARRYFDANGASDADTEIHSFDFTFDSATDTYQLVVTGRVKTTLLGVIGKKWMPLNILSEAKIAPPRSLEIALVLDNTYSMVGAKLDTLKQASTDLVETIMEDVDNEVKVGIVPFSQYVNIGLSRRAETWLDVDDDSSVTTTSNVCRNTYPDRTDTNCVTTNETCSSTRDGVTRTWSCTRTRCDTNYGDPVEVCADETRTSTDIWHGCVGSRNYPFNVRDEQYGARLVPGLMDIYCAQEITPLTTDKVAILADINSMAVQGYETYMPTGLVWGYRTLSNIEPLSEGITYNELRDESGIKALVLMSDGENTKSAQYPLHTKANGIDADRIFEELCDEVKTDGIKLYTIAFEVTDASIRDMLEACASSTGDYFNATNSASLLDAFEAIGLSLTELALTK